MGKGSFVADRLPVQEIRQSSRQVQSNIDRFIAETMPLVKDSSELLALVEKRLNPKSRS